MAEDNQSFCVLPWRHLAVDASGTFRICCRATDILRDGARIPSVYTDSIESVWQSPALQEIRRAMLAGEPLHDCRNCYESERASGASARLDYNREWTEVTGLEAPEAHFADTLQPDSPPDFYHIVLGNLCNLACRMCDSNYSSRIKADPVHSAWAPVSGGAEAARWQNDDVEIAPRPKFGVRLDGFGRLEWRDDVPTRWIAAPAAGIEFEPDAPVLSGLQLRLVADRATRVTIDTGSETLIELPEGVSDHALPLAWSGGSLHIGMTPAVPGARIGLRSLKLVRPRSTGKHNDVFASRFTGKRDWTEQDALLFEEILREPRKLRTLALKGGEPMLAKRFDRIIDFLVDADAAGHIDLEVITNGTIWNEAFAERLYLFRHVDLRVSVDGFGPYYEYIRHPAEWETTRQNIERYARQSGVALHLQPVLQIYNAFNIVELLRYADRVGVQADLQVVYGPERLSVAILPPSIRVAAAERLERYRAAGGRQDVSVAVGYLRHGPDLCSRRMFDEFVAFTNDLDASRNQSFPALNDELIDLLTAEGFDWSTDIRRFTTPAAIAS